MSFLQKKAELKEFWIDYFKFNIWFDRKKKFSLFILSPNSDFINYDDFTRFYLNPNGWIYDFFVEIQDIKTGIRLWFFLINKTPKKNWNNYYKDYYEITGQGLILRDISYYYDILKNLKIDVLGVERVDIACDYTVNTNEFCREVFIPKIDKENITYRPFIKKWIYETLYIWEKDKKKNQYQLIRIYNKKLDTKVKNKSFLYDFERDKDYSRVEIEIRKDKAQFINYLDLLSFDYCFVVFCKAIHRFNYHFFKQFSYDIFKEKSKFNKNSSSLYYSRLEKIKIKQESLDKFWKDFFSKEEEERFLTLTMKNVKRLIKNKYSFNRFLFNLKKYWCYEEEIKQFLINNKSKNE